MPGIHPTWVVGETVKTMQLLPGDYLFQTPSGHADLRFTIGLNDDKYAQMLGGRGTATLVLRGATLGVDVTALTGKSFIIPGIHTAWVEGDAVRTFQVLPGTYGFQTPVGMASFTFPRPAAQEVGGIAPEHPRGWRSPGQRAGHPVPSAGHPAASTTSQKALRPDGA